jgi:hypothetical protein
MRRKSVGGCEPLVIFDVAAQKEINLSAEGTEWDSQGWSESSSGTPGQIGNHLAPESRSDGMG